MVLKIPGELNRDVANVRRLASQLVKLLAESQIRSVNSSSRPRKLSKKRKCLKIVV